MTSRFRNPDQNSAFRGVGILLTSRLLLLVSGFPDQNLDPNPGQNPYHPPTVTSKFQDLGYILYRKLEL